MKSISTLLQISQQKQLSSAAYSPASPGSMLPVPLAHLTGATNGMGDDTLPTSLRAQVQRFQTYTPQQIQEQLQHLHIRQQQEPEAVLHTTAPGVAALLQQRQQPQGFPGSDLQTSQAERDVSPTKDNSGSMLHHLLSQSPKPAPVNAGPSNPFSYHQQRKASYPEGGVVTAPLLASHLRQQNPDPLPQSDLYAMIGNVASLPSHDLPSFPVNIQPREGSPTKGLGRRSPIHDLQMASIAEDTGEEIPGHSGRPFVATSPVNTALEEFPNSEDSQQIGTIPGMQAGQAISLHMKNSLFSHQPQPHVSVSNGTHGPFGYALQQHSSHPSMPAMPSSLNPYLNSHSILTRISTVLSSNGIPHYQSNSGFVVEHEGVKLQILCNLPHLNTIHMQFIAGDAMQYQTLSSQLATQLQFAE